MNIKHLLWKIFRKKPVRTGIISLCVLLLAMVLVPYFYRDTLLRKTKNAISETVNFHVDFKSFQLSLFHGFPNLQIRLKDVAVCGSGPFSKDTLMSAETVASDVSFIKVITGGDITINDLKFDHPRVHLYVSREGRENWKYWGKQSKTVQKKSRDSFKVKLNQILVDHASLIYEDRTPGMSIKINNLDFKIEGPLYGSKTWLQCVISAGGISFDYGGKQIVNQMPVEIKTGLKVDLDRRLYLFDYGRVQIKKVPLIADGGFELIRNAIRMDFSLNGPNCQFEDLLGLLPDQYQQKLKGANMYGKVDVLGFVKGVYSGRNFPSWGVRVKMKDSGIQFKNKKGIINKIKLDLAVDKPQGSLDNMNVTVYNLSAFFGPDSMRMNMVLDHLITDPHYKFYWNGNIDFARLGNSLPVDSLNMWGRMRGDFYAEGLKSWSEKKEFSKIKTFGSLYFKKYAADLKQFSHRVYIDTASVGIKQSQLVLDHFYGRIGRSDFNLKGTLSDVPDYIWGDGTLKGNITFYSSMLDLNQLMIPRKVPAQKNKIVIQKINPEKPNKPSVVIPDGTFRMPDRVNLVLNGKARRIAFNKYNLSGARGGLTIQNKKLSLSKATFGTWGGHITVNGQYLISDKGKPILSLKMNMKNVDISKAYSEISLFRNMVPLAEHSTGSFSSVLNVTGSLGRNMEIQMPTINGRGHFAPKKLTVEGAGALDYMAALLRDDRWRSVSLSDFVCHFKIRNGNLILKPFKVKTSGHEILVSGVKRLDNRINMRLDLKGDRSMPANVPLWNGFFGSLTQLPSSQMDTRVIITGTVSKPQIHLEFLKPKGQNKR